MCRGIYAAHPAASDRWKSCKSRCGPLPRSRRRSAGYPYSCVGPYFGLPFLPGGRRAPWPGFGSNDCNVKGLGSYL
eukprot:8309929-Pyramimonas_sp.AAC.1